MADADPTTSGERGLSEFSLPELREETQQLMGRLQDVLGELEARDPEASPIQRPVTVEYLVDSIAQKDLLGSRDGSLSPEAKAIGIERADTVVGGFFEVHHRVHYSSKERPPDLIFVADVTSAEMPNPTVHIVSIDPESASYGWFRNIGAVNIGFVPDRVSGYTPPDVIPRPDLGRVGFKGGLLNRNFPSQQDAFDLAQRPDDLGAAILAQALD